MGDKYWCDLCSIKKVEICPKTKKRKIGLKFWSTNITRDYIKHLETPKHIKNEDLDKEKSIYCKFMKVMSGSVRIGDRSDIEA